ncbi:MAG: hypothetical protein ABH863_01755, partial [Candidatus Micrarchaeota archaeon]
MDQIELEKKISEVLNVKKTHEAKMVSSLRSYFKGCKKSFAVVGLSGGVDSSLVCYLASKALLPANVFAYLMPYVRN